ncbi:MAG TPA: molybdopterin-dependent oxidoreductase, partial [Nitrospiraceae bacterium]|nr:molybdopterin-dependent oxidoreductase [Nitrospiraceae bacterium]
LLVCQDPFLTETAQLADVVLPACTYAEKEGTFTNLEGRVLRVRPALDPVGESLPDWHIMTAIASGLGYQLDYEAPYDIQREIMRLLPGYYNLGQPRKIVATADAYLDNGYIAEVRGRYQATSTAKGSATARPFHLTMGQLLYHSGKLSTQAAGLIRISPNSGRLSMNPEDMARLGLVPGSKVRVTSSMGALDMLVETDISLMPGSCFFPEHFNEPPVKDLMPMEIDPVTGVPYFKSTPVGIEKL